MAYWLQNWKMVKVVLLGALQSFHEIVEFEGNLNVIFVFFFLMGE